MANIWKQFENLLEKDATLVAEVISINPNNVTVELLSGDRVNVRDGGVGVAAGEMVFIRGGEVLQKTQALPRHDLILY
jgi:hypothetical protein